MARFIALLLIFQLLVVHGATSVLDNSCVANSSSRLGVSFQINSKRNQRGEWLTTLQALKSDGSTDDFDVNVTQTVHDCAAGQALQITVILGNRKPDVFDALRFHQKSGSNAAISNGGKTVSKIFDSVPMDGTVLTNRPLRRNELFEVRLDRKLSSYSHSLSIGITTYTPDNIVMLNYMYSIKSGNWMRYHDHITIHGVASATYRKKDICTLVVGDRVGVMVNEFGVLHFFLNGVDEGPAASNIPETVYGVAELFYNSAKLTIVDPQS